ncbi:MAG: type 4a pilus biogenesis protein PilO, partial [Solirubrobacterales bacterium]|nr:type 4a pilus biogenesis protein PilO [Solirubrobacterales bacterium]
MKASDRGILMALLLVGLLAGIYFMVLAPKREQASALGEEISSLQASIDEEEQVAVFAEQARQEFPKFYSRVVVLGKAVPEQADSASMLVQLNSIANRSDVEFRGIELAEGSGAAEAAPAPAPPAPAD